MSDYEYVFCKDAFSKAITKLGWEESEYEQQHERDYDCRWTVRGWVRDGKWIIRQQDLTQNLIEEIIRIVSLIP